LTTIFKIIILEIINAIVIYKVTLQDNKKHIEKRYTLAIAINKFTKLQLW